MHQHSIEISGIERDEVLQGEEHNCKGETLRRPSKEFHWQVFLAQGYFVSTVGLGEGIVRKISATKSMRMNATQPNEIDV